MSINLSIHPDLLPDESGDWATIEVNGNTVRQCLNDLVRQLPFLDKEIFDEDKLRSHIFIFVNGEDTLPDQLDRLVESGDKLDLIKLRIIVGG